MRLADWHGRHKNDDLLPFNHAENWVSSEIYGPKFAFALLLSSFLSPSNVLCSRANGVNFHG